MAAPLPPPHRQSPATRFELRIAAEARAKEAEARAQKLLDEQVRRADLRDVLPVPAEDDVHAEWERERVCGVETARRRRAREETETETGKEVVVLPWQSGWTSPPQSRVEVASGLEAVQVVAPVEPEPEPVPSGRGMEVDSAAVRKLQADLDDERRHVRKLEDDLRATAREVEQLRAERDEAARRHVQAVCADAKMEAARLEVQVGRLRRQWEESLERQRRLEDEVEWGRGRELELKRRLENARRETRQVEDEREWGRGRGRGRRMEVGGEGKGPGKGREERVVRRSSNKVSDTMTIQKTRIDYAIVVPKRTNAKKSGGCVVM